MKSKTMKRTLSMMMAVLMFVSAFVVTANAEELLPEACGGEIYDIDEVLSDGTVTEKTDDKSEAEAENTESDNDESIAEINPEEEEKAPEPENGVEPENDEGIAETAEIAEEASETEPASENENVQADNTEKTSKAEMNMGVVAGIEAKVVPHPHTREPEEEFLHKNSDLTNTIGDVIIKIGEGLVPFGPSISNFIRSRSKQAKDMDNGETIIDLAADTASFMCPVGAPLVSVAKDIILKIWKLF